MTVFPVLRSLSLSISQSPPNAAAARALLADPTLSAEEVVRRSMEIAGDMCVYTNHNLIVENIPLTPSPSSDATTDTADKSTSNSTTDSDIDTTSESEMEKVTE